MHLNFIFKGTVWIVLYWFLWIFNHCILDLSISVIQCTLYEKWIIITM